ncbi:hypothetical protein HQ563_09560 [bacterium]|nr:hypothetical protein [bacterium]
MILEEVVKGGQELYESRLKELLEPESNGRFVAIELPTGNYFLGSTIVEALENAELRFPNSDFHVVRVGFPGAVSFRHEVVV